MGGILSHFNKEMEVTEGVKMLIDDTISSKKVVIISKSYCPYCVKAKKVINKYNINPSVLEIMEIENRPDCGVIQNYMKQLTGASSVPRVFINGKFIGGGDDTARLDREQALEKMLQECGAI